MICSDNDVENFCLACYVHMNLNIRFLSILCLYVSFLLLASILTPCKVNANKTKYGRIEIGRNINYVAPFQRRSFIFTRCFRSGNQTPRVKYMPHDPVIIRYHTGLTYNISYYYLEM
jgi:hypothetical protein